MDLASWCIKMDVYTKVVGKMTCDRGWGLNSTLIKTHIKASLRTVKLMEWVSISGQTARLMTVSGLMVTRKGMAFGKVLMEIHMSVNGSNLKLKDTVYIFGQQVISMKENGRTALRKVRGQSSLQMETFLSGLIIMDVRVAKGSTSGRMVRLTLVTFLMA